MQGLDVDKLEFRVLSKEDDLSELDFTHTDGSDPLDVDEFIHKEPLKYVNNHLSVIYVVKYDYKPVAYFTLSMSSIGINKLVAEDIVEGVTFRYPALLLGRMGVDRNFRGQNIGQKICSFCRGLAKMVSKRIACAFLILQTNEDILDYYSNKCHFKYSSKDKYIGLIWMYRRLF